MRTYELTPGPDVNPGAETWTLKLPTGPTLRIVAGESQAVDLSDEEAAAVVRAGYEIEAEKPKKKRAAKPTTNDDETPDPGVEEVESDD